MLVAAKVLQAAKYIKEWSNVHEPLKKRTYLGKKKIFKFFGCQFSHAQKPTWKTACMRAGRSTKKVQICPNLLDWI